MAWWSENCWTVLYIGVGYVLGFFSGFVLYVHPWH